MSKAVPKELMPLVDRAAIQYVIEEAAEAGIEQVIIVTARGKEAIADYFDRHLELEGSLAAKGDSPRLSLVRSLSEIVELTYVRQPEQLGLGHAVLCASRAVGDEPFAVLLPDDIIAGERGALSAAGRLRRVRRQRDRGGGGAWTCHTELRCSCP